MASEGYVSSGADHSHDVALHDEIKRRAYQLYERRGSVDGHHLEDGLQAELPRALYAAAELVKYAHGEVGDIKSVRAARVYLRALKPVSVSARAAQANRLGLYPRMLVQFELTLEHAMISRSRTL